MASSSFFAFLFLSFFILSVSNAQPSSSSRPAGLIFPLNFDASTLQYMTKISLGKVPIAIDVVIDLGRKSSLVYSSGGCASTSISGVVTAVGISPVRQPPLYPEDYVSSNVTARGISFGCETNASVLRGLAKGAKGIAGLGRSGLSLASQFSAAFRFPQKFALDFAIFPPRLYFGDGPYPDYTYASSAARDLEYTPLLTNSFFPSDYFIDVNSITIGDSNVTLNKALLSMNKKNGGGGTKLSTLVPYTTMETSIYKAFTSLYIKTAKAMGISAVASVAPFSACFNGSTIGSTPEGYVLPSIYLNMPNNVRWIMTRSGYGYLRYVKDNVACLPYIDGGSKPETSIVIGADQMGSGTFIFDISRSRIGFSPPVQV